MTRGRSDVALQAARHNDEQVARHQAYLADEGPRARHQDTSSDDAAGEESKPDDPPEPR